MHPIVNIAVTAARRAGTIISRSLEHLDKLEIHQKQANDFFSQVDIACEQAIVGIIRKAYPSHAIISEESGKQGGNDTIWVIDPLDGTTNFIHGYPEFAVSIGVLYKGKAEHAVIYNPYNQDLFITSRGKGAMLNDRRIRASKCRTLETALVSSNSACRTPAEFDRYFSTLQTIMPRVGDMRRSGSASLDLANIAAGRLDGFWESGLKVWNVAAGALLVREAGGIITDYMGNEDILSATNSILAGTFKIYEGLRSLIEG